jgi:putative ABC transport system permease protein
MSGMVGAYALSSIGGPRPGIGGPGGGAMRPIFPEFIPNDIIDVWLLSVALSVIAGLYPAWKASGLSPVLALKR